MTNDLIAAQAKQIFALEAQVRAQKEVLEEIVLSLVCIGGPLNDNVLGFNASQRNFLHQIHNKIEDVL